jgi:hypothetical protein
MFFEGSFILASIIVAHERNVSLTNTLQIWASLIFDQGYFILFLWLVVSLKCR